MKRYIYGSLLILISIETTIYSAESSRKRKRREDLNEGLIKKKDEFILIQNELKLLQEKCKKIKKD